MKKYKHRDLAGGHVQEFFMLLPMFAGFCVFTIYPICWVLRWAWFDYAGYGKAIFIGAENFIRIFTRDGNYWRAITNTFYLAAAKLLIEMPLAITLAFFVNNRVKAASVFRIIYFLPAIFSIAVIGLIFTILFSAYNGIVNAFLIWLGIIRENINWFGGRWIALTVVLMVSLWSTFGLNMMYFLMGLQNIPLELYECATLDGASGSRQFFCITIPLLAPVMQVVFMLSMLGTMRIADLVLVMTNGQPGGTTEVVMTYIFKYFFQYGDAGRISQYGYGSALTVVTGIILAVMTIIYLKHSKRMKEIY
ncbi:MAG: sugar ABC transporter permease [Treponema sp.]|jgi:raffinose/stachyose/melibiose transport system permease protein|nr:sugar ABC transporter permease [Treponema sp.]